MTSRSQGARAPSTRTNTRVEASRGCIHVAAGRTRHRATSIAQWRITTSRCGSIRRIRRAYNNRGNIWFHRGDFDRAIADYNQAIQLDPKYGVAYTNRGSALGSKGNFDRAIADFDQAIQLDPKDADAYYSRGRAWSGKGDLDRAIADYNQAIQLNPKYGNAYVNRGSAWGNKGDLDRAIADYRPGDPARSEKCQSLLQPRHGVGEEA